MSSDGLPRRVSDAELTTMVDSYHMLVRKVDTHVLEENEFRILQEKKSEKRDDAIALMIKKIDEMQTSVTALENKVIELEASTLGMVTLFNESKIGKLWLVRSGKFVLWCAAIYGAAKMLIFK